ncbi:MAG TPA: M48 family metalloprotease, partial [Nonomuraea sp.]|nr:M48 family metalloprotease [Nonomuraea sp.]
MFEWFFAPFTRLLLGAQSLLVIPGACGAPVDVLRALTLLLLIAAGVRIRAHCVANRRLRERSVVYSNEEFPGLYDLYREAAVRVGLKRLPPLHQHADEDPLAFTTGCFRPAVFLAPTLVRSLGADELRAVMVHELVHVRRRDNLRALTGSLLPIGALVVLVQVAALYALFWMDQRLGFAHTGLIAAAVLAVLWAFRSIAWPRVVFRRELSCDDRVVEVLQNPLVVAESLVKVWRLQRTLPRRGQARWIHALPLLRTNPTVEQRIRRLIDYRPDPRRAWQVMACRALATAVLVWTSLFLWSYHRSDERLRFETAFE